MSLDSGVLGLPYKNQLCLPTDYHSVNSLALEDCDCNSSEIAYMYTLSACLCLFVLCWSCSCVFLS